MMKDSQEDIAESRKAPWVRDVALVAAVLLFAIVAQHYFPYSEETAKQLFTFTNFKTNW